MKRNISSKVNNTVVSIIPDETSDCSHFEQLSVCVRYFNKKENRPVEHFIGVKRLLSVYDSLTEAKQ